MSHSSASRSLLGLAKSFKQLNVSDPLTQCLAPRLTRNFAAQTQLPISEIAEEIESGLDLSNTASPAITTSASPSELYTLAHPVLATRYRWPQIEPSGYALYNPKYLDAPLRRDILHRAVIYEADATRQGTASTKWRFDVHGSNRKLYQQKGTGKARVRDKKSPIRRGGGVAFGPKPRDFSTELPSKVYRQAFHIALSYRLRRNELVILDNAIELPSTNTTRFLNNVFEANQWGKGNGRSLLVSWTPQSRSARLLEAMEQIGEHAELKSIKDVDVKDLLMSGRVVIERYALLRLLCGEAGVFEKHGSYFTSWMNSVGIKASQLHREPEQIVQYL
ncbi:54S ribosomal protein yml6, mitochondrial [Cladophialophora chaetospira]|uniref:Large ribosomal subunit protein uL4m n=1 Tax=Cladophialophora chaetospira TaxID=386627 RepID=A0AA38X006_9EURO|nr:54S ribosomal protein yml6, mitochondrial [Cladophialophora chaetospira]